MLTRTEKLAEESQERKIIVKTWSPDIGGYLVTGREFSINLSSFRKAKMMICMDQITMFVMLFVWHTELLKFHSPVKILQLDIFNCKRDVNCQAQPSPSLAGLSSLVITKLPTPPGTSQISNF